VIKTHFRLNSSWRTAQKLRIRIFLAFSWAYVIAVYRPMRWSYGEKWRSRVHNVIVWVVNTLISQKQIGWPMSNLVKVTPEQSATRGTCWRSLGQIDLFYFSHFFSNLCGSITWPPVNTTYWSPVDYNHGVAILLIWQAELTFIPFFGYPK